MKVSLPQMANIILSFCVSLCDSIYESGKNRLTEEIEIKSVDEC